MKNNFISQAGVILLLTLFILSGILVVALAAADLVFAGLKMNRLTGYSSLSFFASEAGLERALWEARKDSYALPGQDQANLFENLNLGNNSAYHVNYATSSSVITFTSIGSSFGVKRASEVSYNTAGFTPVCAPDCSGKVCGDDGCGGSCGSCAVNESCEAGACVSNPASSPTGLTLTHSSRSKSFTVSWTAGTNNGGVNGCALQFSNGAFWNDITSGANVNCDTTISNGAFTLNADGWKANWNATQVRLIRKSDSVVMGMFPQTLACSVTSGAGSPTPTIDEDCNGFWDNITAYECNCEYACTVPGKYISYWTYAYQSNCTGTAYTLFIGCSALGFDQSCYVGQTGYICTTSGNGSNPSPCDRKIMISPQWINNQWVEDCCLYWGWTNCSTCYYYY